MGCEQAGPGGDGTFSVPYLIDRENGISYIARYFEYLARRIGALL